MKIAIIGGLGQMDRITTKDLVQTWSGGGLLITDRDEKKAKKFAYFFKRKNVKQKGVLPPELCIDPQIFFSELAKRHIRVYETFQEQIN